jgi:hypothetical protein
MATRQPFGKPILTNGCQILIKGTSSEDTLQDAFFFLNDQESHLIHILWLLYACKDMKIAFKVHKSPEI